MMKNNNATAVHALRARINARLNDLVIFETWTNENQSVKMAEADALLAMMRRALNLAWRIERA